jgi:hemerythrin-like domain-containing protein
MAKRTTRTTRSRRKPAIPDAIKLLKADHAAVQKLFDKYEKSHKKMTNSQKKSIADEICKMLTVHAQIEEEIFYPACRREIDEELVPEALVEHQSAKDLIAKIESGRAGSEQYDAWVMVLGEYIKHHVKEEQSEIFPQARKADLDLKALGQELFERKNALMRGGNGRAKDAGVMGRFFA